MMGLDERETDEHSSDDAFQLEAELGQLQAMERIIRLNKQRNE